MVPNLNRIEEEFKEATNSWNLEKLYLDLASAKGKALTPVEKRLLRGLLCGYSPAEIASTVYQSASSSTVRVYLSNGLYKYMEETLSCQTGGSVKIQNWSRVTQLLEKAGYRNDIVERSQLLNVSTLPVANSVETSPLKSTNQRQDWGEAIDVSVFYGRTEELGLLEQWIVTERCRLVALLGIAGIGKTALSVKLAEQLQGQFDYVIWRSLLHAPSIESLLTQLLQVLSPQRGITILSTVADGISQLIDCLRSSRCLIILDDAGILYGGDRLSDRPSHEEYRELIRRVGDSQHQSCLVLTSREKPQGIAKLQGEALPVRTFILTGLTSAASWKILEAKGLAADLEGWQLLIQRYSGNPSFIKIAATAIQDLFDGSISQFLDWGVVVFGEIRELLDQQFNSLSDLEKQIMYWSVLNQGFVSLQKLQKEMATSASQREILEAIQSLHERSLIEGSSLGFRQKTVVAEYLSEQLVEQARTKVDKEMALFIESQLKNYVRRTPLDL